MLTPYALELIAEEALRAGPGARLELTLPVGTSAAGVARVNRGLCAPARPRGARRGGAGGARPRLGAGGRV